MLQLRTHRKSNLQTVINGNDIFVVPQVFKQALHDGHSLVPDQFIVPLSKT